MSAHVDRKDIRALVTAVAQFAAGVEARLRQIEPVLTLSQLVALERVVQQPRLRPFQLASQMKISRQLAWQTCKRLESLGLLRMSNTDAGKRVVEVEATDAATAHLRQVATLHDSLAGALEARGEGLDTAALRAGLQRLTTTLARMDAGDAPKPGRAEPRARGEDRREPREDAPREGAAREAGGRKRAEKDGPRRRRRGQAAEPGGSPRETAVE